MRTFHRGYRLPALMLGLAWFVVASRGHAEGPLRQHGPTAPRVNTDDQTMAWQLKAGTRRCPGRYANTLLALNPAVVKYETEPGHSFVYCLRTVATYEQVYYGRDGKLKRRYVKARAHGTGFAYRASGNDTLILTNHHVSSWPVVTDEDNEVRGVPAGARRVSEELFIVRNDEDDFEPGYVPLSVVVGDPTLDASVVKARRRLNVMPYALGTSAALRTGDAVEVRGYPLGAFAAANGGKVTNPYVEDVEDKWNHTDFALDALVNRGNSGSPVLAVSCTSGEYELVGLFHAGYRGGEAMNLAVGVDELRTLMDKLQARPRRDRLEGTGVTPELRASVLQSVRAAQDPLQLIRFGDRLVTVRALEDDRLVFRLYGEEYPADPYVYVEVEEAPRDAAPRVTVSPALQPTHSIPGASMDAETREHLDRLTQALLVRLARVRGFRMAAGPPPRSKDQHRRADRLLRDLHRQEKEQKDLVEGLAGHLERARRLALTSAPPPPEAPAAGTASAAGPSSLPSAR